MARTTTGRRRRIRKPSCGQGNRTGWRVPRRRRWYDALVMPAQASFDITSAVDLQEVDNAVNQAKKELGQRYDFKGSKSSIDFKRAENLLELLADDTFKMEAVWDILQT